MTNQTISGASTSDSGKQESIKSTSQALHVRPVATDVVDPSRDVIYYTITLDQSTTSQEIIPDTEGYSVAWVDVSLSGGTTSRVAIQADLSADQSGTYTANMGFTGVLLGTIISNGEFGNGSSAYMTGIAASALRVYTSTTAAGETATVQVMLKGTG